MSNGGDNSKYVNRCKTNYVSTYGLLYLFFVKLPSAYDICFDARFPKSQFQARFVNKPSYITTLQVEFTNSNTFCSPIVVS